MQALNYWLLAARPKTLVVALTPLLVGGTLAYSETGVFHWLAWLAALLAAIGIQIGTNLHNDVSDYERGADTAERLGPKRATAERWLSASSVRRAAFISFGISFVLGIYLVWLGGWPIVLLGLASLLAGYSYTGGARPIAYTPLGELFVLFFFGIAAVAGTYYLQTMQLSWASIIAGIAVGLPAAAVLVINNYRDLDTDRKVGKNTLAGYIGRANSRYLYGLMLLLPLALILPLNSQPALRWLPWLSLPMALWLLRQLWVLPVDQRLNALLAQTAQYQLLLGSLFCLALII
ncbi:MAG: 1,4-dihydroxy-2-naphthoate polyprenyltransferase [Gammaproteobacteria bacterium]|nr:1,4-dihydroxy-2-naphthoate polyprenyltransferase [Gammaproteobacteria bacterium]